MNQDINTGPGFGIVSFISPLQFPLQNGWGRAQKKMDIHLVLRVGGVGPPHFVDPIL